MKNNDYSTSTLKYITSVKKFLKEKYGRVNSEWETVLEILADNVELYFNCRDSIKENGLMLLAKNGSQTRNPLIKTMMDAEIQITKYLSEFGLTPKAQSKIMLQDEENDELKELLGQDV